jgi:hypothetical protein
VQIPTFAHQSDDRRFRFYQRFDVGVFLYGGIFVARAAKGGDFGVLPFVFEVLAVVPWYSSARYIRKKLWLRYKHFAPA